MVSGDEGPGIPGALVRLCDGRGEAWGGDEVADEGVDGALAFACGVLDVNRVASATLRGL